MSTMNVLDSVGATVAVEKPLSPGQALMAASRPVVIALDQSAVPVSGTVTANAGSGTMAVSIASLPVLATGGNVIGGVTQSGAWNITNISGTISLPTGAATAANQAALNALFPASLGTKTAANSLAVTLASDGAMPVAIGTAADAVVANGSGGTIAGYLRTIKDAATDTTTVSPVKIDQTTPGTTDAVTIKSPADVISFTPTLDTAAYASGDVLFATAAISGVTRANDLRAILSSLTVIDKSKQNPAFTLLFYQTNVTSAAANAANALSDADQINCLGFVNIAAADYLTFANNSVLCYSGAKAPNLMLEAATGTTTVYVVGILQAGTPTFAVGDLVLKLGLVQS